MHVIYKEIVNIRRRKVLIYCPRQRFHSKNIIRRLLQPFNQGKRKFFWISKIQTEKVVDRSYNLEFIKSYFFTKVDSTAEK